MDNTEEEELELIEDGEEVEGLKVEELEEKLIEIEQEEFEEKLMEIVKESPDIDYNDVTRSFLKRLGSHPVLTRQREYQLCRSVGRYISIVIRSLCRLKLIRDKLVEIKQGIISDNLSVRRYFYIKSFKVDKEKKKNNLEEFILPEIVETITLYDNKYEEYLDLVESNRRTTKEKAALTVLFDLFVHLNVKYRFYVQLYNLVIEYYEKGMVHYENILKAKKNKKKKDPESVKKIEDIEEIMGLDFEDFITLVARIKKARDSEIYLKQEFLKFNFRLMIFMANVKKNFLKNIIEAVEGGFTALHRFDYTKHNKYSTYAYHWIKQSIKKNNRIKPIKIPSHQNDLLNKFYMNQTILSNTFGREATLSEVADYIGEDPIKIRRILDFSKEPTLLEKKTSNEDTTLSDYLLNNEEDKEEEVIREEANLNRFLTEFYNYKTPKEEMAARQKLGLTGYKKEDIKSKNKKKDNLEINQNVVSTVISNVRNSKGIINVDQVCKEIIRSFNYYLKNKKYNLYINENDKPLTREVLDLLIKELKLGKIETNYIESEKIKYIKLADVVEVN